MISGATGTLLRVLRAAPRDKGPIELIELPRDPPGIEDRANRADRRDYQFGYAVVSLPDLDGDGLADVCVLSTGEKLRFYSGARGELLREISLHHGSSNQQVRLVGDIDGDGTLDLLASWGLYSTRSGEYLGPSLGWEGVPPIGTALGDLDGDGHIDWWDHVVPDGISVHSGSNGEELYTVRDPFGSRREFGYRIVPTGDVDSDGVTDFAVGAPAFGSPDKGYDQVEGGEDAFTGQVFVFSGARGTLLKQLSDVRPGTEFGAALAAGRDVDGDGTCDLLVGSTGMLSEQVCVYSGKTWRVLLRINGLDFVHEFAERVHFIDDVTGDGLPDLAVTGFPGMWRSGHPPGYVCVLSSATGETQYRLDPPWVASSKRALEWIRAAFEAW